ncbi:MAG: VOC family protein [Actinomycetota bacterium]|nr:VOC family protein [Actinomycetota bacterium]
MLTDSKAFSSFSVDDVSRAQQFYSETLGLRVTKVPDMEGLLTLHVTGDRDVLVYGKQDHAPASFTILNFPVEDVERAVDALVDRGVHFERYDGLLNVDDKGIFRGGGPAIAWFKDPAGNVLSVMQRDS